MPGAKDKLMASVRLYQSDSPQSPLKTPDPSVTHFYTSGRILSFFPQVNKNGYTFFKDDVPDNLVSTLVGSTTDIQHVKPGYGVRDHLVAGETNTICGAITEAVKKDDGIYIINKIERGVAKNLGFDEHDFGPGSILGKLSQECDYSIPQSEWIVVDAKDPSKIVSRHSYADGCELGFELSHVENGAWKYFLQDGNPVFMAVKPMSFSGVGHVEDPADPSATITKLAAASGWILDEEDRELLTSNVHKFIQKAIKHHGALTKKAKAAGMSIDKFAEAHKHDGDETGAQARFYLEVLKKAAHNNSFLPGMDDGPNAPELMKIDGSLIPNGVPNFVQSDFYTHPDLLNADVGKYEDEPDDDDKVPDDHFAACYSDLDYSNVTDGKAAPMTKRLFRIKNDKGEYDRKRLIAAYRALVGIRGNINAASMLPSSVQHFALARVRHGLKETNKVTKGVSRTMNTLLAGYNMTEAQEREAIATVEAHLLSTQKVYSKVDMEARDAEIANLKAQVETLTASVNEAKTAIQTLTTDKDTLTASLQAIESAKVADARFADLDKVIAFTDDEKKAETFPEFMKSLAAMSQDAFQIQLQARTITKLSSAVEANKLVSGVHAVNPVPTVDMSKLTAGAEGKQITGADLF